MNKRTKDEPLHTTLWERPGYLVRRLHQIHIGLFFEECGKYEITPVQYGILTVLYSTGKVDQITLANEVGIDRSSIADVIQRLESRCLIKRIMNPTDKRAKLTQITAKGKTLVHQLEKHMEAAQLRFLSPLKEKEQERFIYFMTKLIQANNNASRAPGSN